MLILQEDVTLILDYLSESFNNKFWLSDKKEWLEIDERELSWFAEYLEEEVGLSIEDSSYKSFLGLVDYKVNVKKDGEHKTDGQLVEYTFTFKKGKEKKVVTTNMCLMLGFDYHKNLEF